jgi:hypothetical protein
LTETISVVPSPEIPFRRGETQFWRSAVVKNPTSSPDFGDISPVQLGKQASWSAPERTFESGSLPTREEGEVEVCDYSLPLLSQDSLVLGFRLVGLIISSIRK